MKNNEENTQKSGYAAFAYRDFWLFIIAQFIVSLGGQMLSFAVAWELWLRTHDAFALGLVGLVQVIPVILFSLPAGHVADHYNRKKIIFITQILFSVCSFGLALISFFQGPVVLVYLCLFGIGIAHAFNNPAASTLLPQTVPPEAFTSAATWSSSAWQFASVVGPALGGFLIWWLNQAVSIYVFDGIAAILFILLAGSIKGRKLALSTKEGSTLESLADGLRFIAGKKVILAAITLDMFAVLLGGAVSLLPIYATDILKVGSLELGIMRAAPSIGALLMAFLIAYLPPFKQAGKTLLWAVVGFGLATIVFGLSTSLWLSVAMLVLLGGLDNISVVIRSTLMLTLTPDEMRGRTSAVNNIFIGASNELGGFESGVAAGFFGPVISVVGGGIGTILVVLGIAKIWPELTNLKTLDPPKETAAD